MTLQFRRLASAALVATAAASMAGTAAAQNYPEKNLTFFVPFAAGSATDQLARALGQSITAQTKQAVIVDNRPGASGFIAAQAAARAPADGHAVLITTNTTHAANEHLYKKLPYDPVKDFKAVSLLGKGGQIMVVNPKLPVKTVMEFVELARKEPGKRTFGSGSSSSRIAGELFQQMADVKLVHVPYKSNPMGVTDLLGGQIDMMITDAATGLPQVSSGKLKALGVSSLKRSPLAPDVPTIDEAGVKGYEMGYWFGAYVPAGTPDDVVKRLNELLVKATQSAETKNFYDSTGTEPVSSTPEELTKFQAAESQKWGAIIKAAGIEAE
jgi:tripartite-type tricarboxylate transporter receptor subunit TctC